MKIRNKSCIVIILTVLFLIQSLAMGVGAEEENLAEGKPVFGSTEWPGLGVAYTNDGDENTYWSSGSAVLQGKDGGFEYVGVDLEKKYLINKIVVMSARGNDNPLARSGWVVQLSNDPAFRESVTVGRKNEAGAYLSDLVITLTPDDGYRYVRVVSPNYFLMSELMVYGEEMGDGGIVNFEDTKGTTVEGAALVMQALGIMQGETRKELGAYYLVSRAEAVEAVMKTVKLPQTNPDKQFFEDVPKGLAYAPWINTAVTLGIVSQAENFRPDDAVTVTELMNMIEMALGYGDILKANGGYPVGTIVLGNQLGLLKNVETETDSPVNRGVMAHILYNTLTQPLKTLEKVSENGVTERYERGDTILGQKYGMRIEKGVVTASRHTMLSTAGKLAEGSIQIGGHKYKDDAMLLQNSLGKSVTFLIDENEPDIIICGWENADKNITVRIDDEDIRDIADGIIVYDDGNRNCRENISTADIIFNGICGNDRTWEALCPDYGYIELLDNDNDGDWEVVFVNEYTFVVVDYVSVNDGITVIGGLNGKTVRFEECNIDPTGLKKNTLVTAVVAGDNSYCHIEPTENVISGIVEEISDDTIKISDVSYVMTKYFMNEGLMPGINEHVTAVLNGKNEIVWIPEPDEFQNLTLGLIQGAASTSEIGGKTQIRMFTQGGVFQDYDIAERVYVDGKYYKGETLLNVLGATYFSGKIAGIKRLGSTVVYIDTETVSPGEPEDSLRPEQTPAGILGTAFCQKLNGFYDGWRAVMPAMTNGLTLVIPVIGQDVNTGTIPGLGESMYNGYFSARTVGQVFHDLYVGWGAQRNGVDAVKVVPFNFSETGYPEFIVKYELRYAFSQGAPSQWDFKAINEEWSYSMMITKTGQMLTDSGEECFALTGIDLNSGSEIVTSVHPEITKVIESYLVHNEKREWLYGSSLIDDTAVAQDLGLAEESRYVKKLDKLRFGDIVKFTVANGHTVAIERVLPYDPSVPADTEITPTGRWLAQGGSYPGYPYANFAAIYAEISKAQDGALTFVQGDNISETLQQSAIPKVFLCNDKKITEIASDTLGMYSGDKYRLFIYTDSGTPRFAIVYQYN